MQVPGDPRGKGNSPTVWPASLPSLRSAFARFACPSREKDGIGCNGREDRTG